MHVFILAVNASAYKSLPLRGEAVLQKHMMHSVPLTHRVTNPLLLLPLGFCVAAWWFISVKEKEYHVHHHVKLFGALTHQYTATLSSSVMPRP